MVAQNETDQYTGPGIVLGCAPKDPFMKLHLNTPLPASSRPLAFGLALASLLLSGVASAHISLEQGGGLMSRDGEANLKQGPCGLAGSKRGTNIYTYAPGESVEIKIKETIPHPSYFRIAFDKDGDDGFIDPKSIKPIDPNRPCPFDANDKCGTTDDSNDFYNTPEVLMDNLDPHLSNNMLGNPYSWQVTMPNYTCDNCTLQIIQVMEDTIHGAYNPDPADPSLPDIYHQCLDIVLDGPVQPSDDAGTGGAKTPAPASKDTSGCSVAAPGRSTGHGYWGVTALGLAWLVARRSRATIRSARL
jgi:MYXO-CTERM domain-containing protein